jgi:hypothetical protein
MGNASVLSSFIIPPPENDILQAYKPEYAGVY